MVSFTAPVFGSEIVSARIKLFLSILIGILIFPFITAIDLSKANNLLMILIIIKELLIGIATGLIGRFLFVGVQFGGR